MPSPTDFEKLYAVLLLRLPGEPEDAALDRLNGLQVQPAVADFTQPGARQVVKLAYDLARKERSATPRFAAQKLGISESDLLAWADRADREAFGLYAEQLVARNRARALASAAKDAVAKTQAGDGKEALDELSDQIAALQLATEEDAILTLHEATEQFMEWFNRFQEEIRSGKIRWSFQFEVLDEMVPYVFPGHAILITAASKIGKCLAGDTRIPDPVTGCPTPIREIQAGSSILTLTENLKVGASRAVQAICQGKQETYRLTTRSGRHITATENHPFLTPNGWTELLNLKSGDRLAVPRRLPVAGKAGLAAHETVFLALMLGDGHMGSCPVFTNADPAMLDEFEKAVGAFGNTRTTRFPNTRSSAICIRVAKIVASETDKERARNALRQVFRGQPHEQRKALAKELGRSLSAVKSWTRPGSHMPGEDVHQKIAELTGVSFSGLDDRAKCRPAKLLESLGLLGAVSGDKFVPGCIFQLDDSGIALFLNRLFACDGYASGKYIGYNSKSERLVDDVMHLLLRLGIFARKMSRTNKHGTYYEAILGQKPDIIRFASRVNILGKEDKVAGVREKAESRRHIAKQDTIPMSLILQASRQAPAQLKQAGVNRKSSSVTRETAGHIPGCKALAKSDIYWDTVASVVPAGVQETYDIEVEGTHNFVANDFVVHNSSILQSWFDYNIRRGFKGILFHFEDSREVMGIKRTARQMITVKDTLGDIIGLSQKQMLGQALTGPQRDMVTHVNEDILKWKDNGLFVECAGWTMEQCMRVVWRYRDWADFFAIDYVGKEHFPPSKLRNHGGTYGAAAYDAELIKTTATRLGKIAVVVQQEHEHGGIYGTKQTRQKFQVWVSLSRHRLENESLSGTYRNSIGQPGQPTDGEITIMSANMGQTGSVPAYFFAEFGLWAT